MLIIYVLTINACQGNFWVIILTDRALEFEGEPISSGLFLLSIGCGFVKGMFIGFPPFRSLSLNALMLKISVAVLYISIF